LPDQNSQFDRVAKAYEAVVPSHVKHHYLEKRLKCFTRETGSKGFVLDCGCGTGIFAEALHRHGKRVIGLDNSIGMLREARGKTGVSAVCGDSLKLPFRTGVFDTVAAVGLIHHILEKDQIERCLRDMIRVTRKGGKVIIMDPNPGNPYWTFFNKKFPLDPEKEKNIPTRLFIEIFSRCDVKDIRYFYSGIIPDFTPPFLMFPFKAMETLLEHTPLINRYLAHQTLIVTK